MYCFPFKSFYRRRSAPDRVSQTPPPEEFRLHRFTVTTRNECGIESEHTCVKATYADAIATGCSRHLAPILPLSPEEIARLTVEMVINGMVEVRTIPRSDSAFELS